MCKSKDMKNGVARQRSLIAKRCHSGVVRPINPIVTTFNSSHPSHIHPPKNTLKNHGLGGNFTYLELMGALLFGGLGVTLT